MKKKDTTKEHTYEEKRFERERYYEESTYEKEKGSTNKKRYTSNYVGIWYKLKHKNKNEKTLSSEKRRRIIKLTKNIFEL